MADNYIEKKFEEHFALRAKPVKRASASLRTLKPDYIQIHFPKRRVFIIGEDLDIVAEIIEAFRNANCKVAFCDSDTKNGNAIAQHTGARFYPGNFKDSVILDTAIHDVVSLWGDIDIIITIANSETNMAIAKSIAQLRSVQNNANPYGRMIVISDDNSYNNLASKFADMLAQYNITVNSISSDRNNLGAMCIFLSLPEASFINGMNI